MKKFVLVGLLSVGAFALAGCSLTDKVANKVGEVAAEKVLESATNGGDVQITNDSFTYTDSNTNTTLSYGEDIALPSDFPDDVPVYDDAKVTSSMSSSSDGSYNVTMSSTDSFDSINSFYASEIVKDGWKIDNTGDYNSGESGKSTIYYASKDTRSLTVGVYTGTDVAGAYTENGGISITLSVVTTPTY